eukprot:1158059-Pelagomonas_calceolata.AAC.2
MILQRKRTEIERKDCTDQNWLQDAPTLEAPAPGCPGLSWVNLQGQWSQSRMLQGKGWAKKRKKYTCRTFPTPIKKKETQWLERLRVPFTSKVLAEPARARESEEGMFRLRARFPLKQSQYRKGLLGVQ